MQDGLTDRGKKILETIIEDYIATAEPVGSRAITRRHGISLSPATIRNVMADLEEMGFLCSPHTSAGRIPTDKAYRLYVDSLLEVREMARDEQEEIRRRCRIEGRDMDSVLKETSQILSSVSHYMGIVAAPRFAANVFRHLEFVKLNGRRILAVIVSSSGTVQNRIIEADIDLSPADLVRMSNYLNEMLEGLTIAQVRQKILEEMAREKNRYDQLFSRALRLSQQTMEETADHLFIEGQANILDLPEFADVGTMKEIFRAFEEKGQLLGLLDRCLEAPGVRIFIGSESPFCRMARMSLITATYRTGRDTMGVLGVIGPTRMGYSKVIPIVDYTARLVSRLLEND